MKIDKLKNNIIVAIIGVLGFLFSFFIAKNGFSLDFFEKENTYPEISNEDIYRPQKEEIVLVYIGSSVCAISNNEQLPGYFHTIKDYYKNKAKEDSLGFLTVGISKDYNVSNGIEHLAKYGAFNEIMTGNSWHNLGLSRYLYDDYPGDPSTPQIVIMKRIRGEYNGTNGKKFYRGIDSEEEVKRIMGLREIEKFINVIAVANN